MSDSSPGNSQASATSAVIARIEAAEVAAGRGAGSVTLIGASKTRTIHEVRAAHALGVLHFGENYAQELELKAPAVPDATWHFIGHLQRNKAKSITQSAEWLHTLDTPRLADHLDRLLTEAGRTLRVLIEVNLGGEESKSGVAEADVRALAEHVLARCPRLQLRGLMTIPPPDQAPERWYRALAQRSCDLGATLGHPLPELSMGMSDDLEVAIACGATFVRVGTALFGPRAPR